MVLLQLAGLEGLADGQIEIEKLRRWFLTLCHSVVPLKRRAPQSGSNLAFLASVESPLAPFSAGLLEASMMIEEWAESETFHTNSLNVSKKAAKNRLILATELRVV